MDAFDNLSGMFAMEAADLRYLWEAVRADWNDRVAGEFGDRVMEPLDSAIREFQQTIVEHTHDADPQ